MPTQTTQTKTTPRVELAFLVMTAIGTIGVAVGLAIFALQPKAVSTPVVPTTNTASNLREVEITGTGSTAEAAQADLEARVAADTRIPANLRSSILATPLAASAAEVVKDTVASASGDLEKISVSYPFKCSCRPEKKGLCLSGTARKCSNNNQQCTSDNDCGPGHCGGTGYACYNNFDCQAPQQCTGQPTCSGGGSAVCLSGRVSNDSISLSLTITF